MTLHSFVQRATQISTGLACPRFSREVSSGTLRARLRPRERTLARARAREAFLFRRMQCGSYLVRVKPAKLGLEL